MQQQIIPSATMLSSAIARPYNTAGKTSHTNTTNKKQRIMKKAFSFFALFLLAFTATAQNTHQNALKINPLSLLIMMGNVSYERALSASHSFQVGGFYSGAGADNFKYQGYGIVPEFRFYFGGQRTPLNGAYIAPFGRYQNLSITNKNLRNKASFTTIGGGAVAGYQKRWESGFILNVFAGPSFNKLSFENNNSVANDFDLQKGMNGFGMRTGLTLGFSF
jgi:hypothetical protein